MQKIIFFLFLLFGLQAKATQIIVPMDAGQSNHLKAYGAAFFVLENEVVIEWLLNYRGGAFLMPHLSTIEDMLIIRGVSYEILADGQVEAIKREIANPEVNQEVVQLEKAPKIAVYTPGGKQPWDDAVTLVMEYAEIPYDKVYDSTVIAGGLVEYDWLHLHHEDFTGQYGKFYANFKNAPWYRQQVAELEQSARKLGFEKVSDMKLAVAANIKSFVFGGGFLFTMCSGTDSYDIALAAHETDICEDMYDGDPADPNCQEKLDYSNSFAFENYELEQNPLVYEYSEIDGTADHRKVNEKNDYFTLFDFSAKWDVVPTMLTQCHTDIIPGFYGQTTDFRKEYIKSNVTIMGESQNLGTVRYIHGEHGMGTWTFYGGHDPEDYQHRVGDPPTDLNLHPNSPGYRLILNNILFPAAKKKKRKT
ncbi:asparagine synthetase B [Lishizhenia sp.]|uniref:asparagine synthetase B n=1 Tax=Lishizhenia sp. TaxID=2497594 RepID=UPI00299CE2E9|nr:asparagine synthetase B [Lishizhenia sp.]MDX1446309.1 asparagine synthetase B [Lishizhenia sp.]